MRETIGDGMGQRQAAAGNDVAVINEPALPGRFQPDAVLVEAMHVRVAMRYPLPGAQRVSRT